MARGAEARGREAVEHGVERLVFEGEDAPAPGAEQVVAARCAVGELVERGAVLEVVNADEAGFGQEVERVVERGARHGDAAPRAQFAPQGVDVEVAGHVAHGVEDGAALGSVAHSLGLDEGVEGLGGFFA